MIKLTKTKGRDFLILNLTDPQITEKDWHPGERGGEILKYTVQALISGCRPDLITVSGDFSYSGDMASYRNYAEYFDTFGIPWTCCFGNHDNQGGAEFIFDVIAEFRKHPLFLYEECDAALGNGNHVIVIEEDGKAVEGIIMMDTHDRLPYKTETGEETMAWAKLGPGQIEWYRDRVAELDAVGCHDTTVITHIPIYAYRTAWEAAVRKDIDPLSVEPRSSTGAAIWNRGYENAFGVRYEEICSYPEDEGMFDAIRALGSTKTIVCGHDHKNDFVITYEGVRFVYGLKLGAGCYWDPKLNGGTYLTVTPDGVTDIRQEYVDVTAIL